MRRISGAWRLACAAGVAAAALSACAGSLPKRAVKVEPARATLAPSYYLTPEGQRVPVPAPRPVVASAAKEKLTSTKVTETRRPSAAPEPAAAEPSSAATDAAAPRRRAGAPAEPGRDAGSTTASRAPVELPPAALPPAREPAPRVTTRDEAAVPAPPTSAVPAPAAPAPPADVAAVPPPAPAAPARPAAARRRRPSVDPDELLRLLQAKEAREIAESHAEREAADREEAGRMRHGLESELDAGMKAHEALGR